MYYFCLNMRGLICVFVAFVIAGALAKEQTVKVRNGSPLDGDRFN